MPRAEIRAQIDVNALYHALDAERQARGLSWRAMAAEIGVSPSTMTRLANGHRPDADGFAAMISWLGLPAEQFIRRRSTPDSTTRQPNLMAELAPLLRSRAELDESDVRALEDIIQAAYKLRASRHRE